MKYKQIAFYIGDMPIERKHMFIDALFEAVDPTASRKNFYDYIVNMTSMSVNFYDMGSNAVMRSDRTNPEEKYTEKGIPMIRVMDELNSQS